MVKLDIKLFRPWPTSKSSQATRHDDDDDLAALVTLPDDQLE